MTLASVQQYLRQSLFLQRGVGTMKSIAFMLLDLRLVTLSFGFVTRAQALEELRLASRGHLNTHRGIACLRPSDWEEALSPLFIVRCDAPSPTFDRNTA
jgi:hypothetical protein